MSKRFIKIMLVLAVIIATSVITLVYVISQYSDTVPCPPFDPRIDPFTGQSAPITYRHPYLPFFKTIVGGNCGYPIGWLRVE